MYGDDGKLSARDDAEAALRYPSSIETASPGGQVSQKTSIGIAAKKTAKRTKTTVPGRL